MVKVSVLIPVYNVEKYLRQCLSSVVSQTLKEIEIICIDDGSTDSSGKILDEYAAQDSRIKVIHKANAGYGNSMNRAMEMACGEYIGILESDDFAEPDMYDFLYRKAVENKLDCIKSNYYRYSENGREYYEILKNFEYDKVFSQYEMMEKFNTAIMGIWAGIYRREFLLENNIRFLETPGASYQDLSFWFKVYVSAKRCYFTKEAFINYRTDNSNSSVKSKDKVYFICDEIAECKKYLQRSGCDLNVFYPHAIKVMYQAYTWNATRISFCHLESFIDKILPEMRQDKRSKYMDPSLFTEWEWRDFEYLTELPEEYVRLKYNALLQMSADNESIYVRALLKYLCSRNIYIYGAGKVGKRLEALLKQNEYGNRYGFLVSEKEDEDEHHNIKYIGDALLHRDWLVVIAVADRAQRIEMASMARKNGFEDIFVFDNTLGALCSKVLSQ